MKPGVAKHVLPQELRAVRACQDPRAEIDFRAVLPPVQKKRSVRQVRGCSESKKEIDGSHQLLKKRFTIAQVRLTPCIADAAFESP